MTIRSPDGAFTSESLFDSPSEAAFYISNITEWRKDIPTPLGSGQDFSFSSDFQDMQSSEHFEFKDTASQCSMDSAYQSQTSASRRGTKRPQPYPQDTQSTMGAHFVGSDIYSPSMSSDSYNAFQDMNQMQLPAAWDTQNGSMGFANYSTGQDFSLYPTSNISQFNPTSAVNVWGPVAAPYNFTSYSTESNETMFNTAAPVQRQWNNVRPAPVRSSSSYFTQQAARRTPSHDASFNAFVASPTSTASVQLHQAGDFEQTQYVDQRNETEDSTSTSLAPQSLTGHEDVQSPIDAAEAKLEEERTKVARSHVLYQQGPDKDGKYHCPEEGKPGCTHKPTPLKCNYDKYVDSHLKPFRCNKKTCVGVQFSSTACLLRHEREAHGMHGHGARPHLCHFQDCERAVPGHGFPRRYNLFDHMKRVHQFDGPTTEPSPPMQGQMPRKPVSRKRKASAEDITEKRSKVIKLTAEQQLQQRRDQLTQDFLIKKQHIVDFLTNLAGPNELSDDLKLSQDVMALHDISTKFRSSLGG
ncbi:uncharacterized protein EKO05_0007825 [Ascochyta rabiei]|uniref:uncharacterized protein n=1 Tax=Didymella rabiei TaxID=5454 RepID=UPI00220D0F19|nr:uncharacterized protein EKO05_0007825 [Ascochyta rabiei]UPX17473.1 hypothetical protein EKO05_0007825 [Ascochyta rabiei]